MVWRALIGRLVQGLGWRFFGCDCDDAFDTRISLRPRFTSYYNKVPRTPKQSSLSTCPQSYVLSSEELSGAPSPPRRSFGGCWRAWRVRQVGRKERWRGAMESHMQMESGRSYMDVPSTRVSGVRSWCLRPWWSSQSSYVFSVVVVALHSISS